MVGYSSHYRNCHTKKSLKHYQRRNDAPYAEQLKEFHLFRNAESDLMLYHHRERNTGYCGLLASVEKGRIETKIHINTDKQINTVFK